MSGLAGDRWFDTWSITGVEVLPELSHTTAERQTDIRIFHHSFTEKEKKKDC